MATTCDGDHSTRYEAECTQLRQRVEALEAERLALIAQHRQEQERSRADLVTLTRLHQLSTSTVALQPFLQNILDTAISISGADFGHF